MSMHPGKPTDDEQDAAAEASYEDDEYRDKWCMDFDAHKLQAAANEIERALLPPHVPSDYQAGYRDALQKVLRDVQAAFELPVKTP